MSSLVANAPVLKINYSFGFGRLLSQNRSIIKVKLFTRAATFDFEPQIIAVYI